MARNAEFMSPPQLGAPRGWSYGPVLFELSFKPPAPALAAVPSAVPMPGGSNLAKAGPAPSSLPPALAPVFRQFSIDERVFWLIMPVAGAALLLLLLLVPYRWVQARRQTQALVLRQRTRNAVVVDFGPATGELAVLGIEEERPATLEFSLKNNGLAAT